MKPLSSIELLLAAGIIAILPTSQAGLYRTGSPLWPGGMIPYAWDASVPVGLRETYLAGLMEWELAGNIAWVERTTETVFMTLKFDASAASGSFDSSNNTVTMIALNRRLVCHESGHGLGLEHEHSRHDRDTYISVLTANIQPSALFKFDKLPGATVHGDYDFESVMHYERNEYSIDPDNLNSMEPRPGFELFSMRMSNRTLSPGDLSVVAHLYGAGTLLSPVVTNTQDTGVGSLRAAIYYANDNPGSTITFAIPNSDPGFAWGVYTIRVTGDLPTLVADGTTIDGCTQPGYVSAPVITVSGEDLIAEAGEVTGLTVYAGNCMIRGLAIHGFSDNGIGLFYENATNNTIEGCFIGLKPDGLTASPNARQGVAIWGSASNNQIGTDATPPPGHNVISDNTEYGVLIVGPTTTGNTVAGNYIGTNAAGSAALGKGKSGVAIWGGAHDNTVGGTTVAARNLISGNVEYGAWISDAGRGFSKSDWWYGDRCCQSHRAQRMARHCPVRRSYGRKYVLGQFDIRQRFTGNRDRRTEQRAGGAELIHGRPCGYRHHCHRHTQQRYQHALPDRVLLKSATGNREWEVFPRGHQRFDDGPYWYDDDQYDDRNIRRVRRCDHPNGDEPDHRRHFQFFSCGVRYHRRRRRRHDAGHLRYHQRAESGSG